MFFGHLVAGFDAVLCYAVPLLWLAFLNYASAYHCLSLRCNASANPSLVLPSLICALSCHLRNLSMPRPSYHFSAMPLPRLSELCLFCTFLSINAVSVPYFAVQCLCSSVPDSPVPSHNSLCTSMPYHIVAHPCCAVAIQSHALAMICHAHCIAVHSCAFAILCLAQIRCAFAFNPVSCIAFASPSQFKSVRN